MPLKSMVASIGTGLVNNALSQGNAQEQREWQEKMWKMQNAYNHPAAMADRMRAAGLNPYTMQGAEPAGSVGTGATAQTIPLDNPLAYAKTFAEIDNLTASTTKTDLESGKLLKDMSMLDLMYSRGLLEKEEYEFNMKKYYEAWKEKNPYTLEAEETEAGIANTKADTELKQEQKVTEQSKQSNLQANTTATTDANTRANDIHDLNKKALNKQITLAEYQAQSAQLANRIASNEAEKSDTDAFVRTLTGIDMERLNPVLVPIVYQFAEAERRRMLTDEQFSAYVVAIQSYLSQERIMFLKKDPDYITALEGKQLSLEQRKQLFTEVLAQFNAELASKELELDAISTVDKVFNIFK